MRLGRQFEAERRKDRRRGFWVGGGGAFNEPLTTERLAGLARLTAVGDYFLTLKHLTSGQLQAHANRTHRVYKNHGNARVS